MNAAILDAVKWVQPLQPESRDVVSMIINDRDHGQWLPTVEGILKVVRPLEIGERARQRRERLNPR
jgi:hypothetical protein